ncbi:MAG: type II toxin-antitoxin system VapC family toxin [Peptococcaceae bacterium]|nr:type II toxin-antitoxin system VapC family toxin [Peptococcaceae bacterium]
MSPVYVLDACAILAVLSRETGADKVVDLYKKAGSGEVVLIINKLNLLEVYYNLLREYGTENANKFLKEIKQSPITIIHEISDGVFLEAGKLKVSYKISLADSIALAEAAVSGGMLVTADHHEFDVIDQSGDLKFFWIR